MKIADATTAPMFNETHELTTEGRQVLSHYSKGYGALIRAVRAGIGAANKREDAKTRASNLLSEWRAIWLAKVRAEKGAVAWIEAQPKGAAPTFYRMKVSDVPDTFPTLKLAVSACSSMAATTSRLLRDLFPKETPETPDEKEGKEGEEEEGEEEEGEEEGEEEIPAGAPTLADVLAMLGTVRATLTAREWTNEELGVIAMELAASLPTYAPAHLVVRDNVQVAV